MFNTIILKAGQATLAEREYERFQKGDTIFGADSEPEELKRWLIEDDEDAKKELARYSCEYIKRAECWDVIEYALEYCECDEDGEFIQGSDFELATE